jgi:hypothetical protein
MFSLRLRVWSYLKGRELACRAVCPDLPLTGSDEQRSPVEQAAVVKVRAAADLRFLVQVEDLQGLLLYRYSQGTS